MSRSGYTDDYDDEPWQAVLWRASVARAIKGKRGQAFLRELVAALDAMPVKRLIAHELRYDGEVCAIGAVGAKRGVELETLDPEDYNAISDTFDIAQSLVREIEWINDQAGPSRETPEHRWQRIRDWAAQQLTALHVCVCVSHERGA